MRRRIARKLENNEPRTIPLAGELLEMLKIEREKNHDLRRTGVRNLVRAGVPERYNIVSGRDLEEAARKLEAYLAKENGDKTGTIEADSGKAPQLIH